MKIKNVITWLFLIGILITVIAQKTRDQKKEIEKVTKRITKENEKVNITT